MDQFDVFFRRADSDGDGRISGDEAIAFFEGSNLPKSVLAQIWQHADQNNTGFLGREEFYNALKLVTVAQSKRELTADIVNAALYGPAWAKIPAPQINLAAPYKIYGVEEIATATNNFSAENLITEGVSLGKVYKGQLLRDGNLTKIMIRRLDCEDEQEDKLQTEILMLKRFKNKDNIASISGHCNENNEKIIVYEHAFHGTLDQHLCDATLTWSQRLQICLGVARGLNHVHYDVIHCDINTSKIFLDKDWEPKIYGFEISTEYPPSWRHRLLSTNNTTPKYDVYCFGVLLFEVLCGRKPMITSDGVQEKPDGIIDLNLRKQINTKSLELFKEIASKCLNQQPVKRPTMDQIIKELDSVLECNLEVAKPELPMAAADESTSLQTSFKRLMMDFLSIPLSKIKEETNDFDEKNRIGSGGYGKVYRAELDVLNINGLSSMKGKHKDEMPKIRKTVAIKCIIRRADEQAKQGFLTEIELLSSCRHPNVISLLGYSEDNGEIVIVYEYAFGGSLSGYLESGGPNLTWAQRVQICLDVAHGIDYLHTNTEDKPMIIHRDIKSDNILLDENLNAKVADFGLSKSHPTQQHASTINATKIAGTDFYMDPEYVATAKYKRASDIYSFGVVLFEVMSGRLAYDPVYTSENHNGLAPIARRHYIEGTIKELLDPKMLEDNDHVFTLNRGPEKESFDRFSTIAYECLAETQAKRPTIKAIISELQNALISQGKTRALSRYQFDEINSATKNFDETYCIGVDTSCMVYKADLDHCDNYNPLSMEGKNISEPSKKRITVAIKRLTGRKGWLEKQRFFAEIERATIFKHPKITSLLGFCDDGDEMILVYKHNPSNQSLNEYLKSVDSKNNLTWSHRLYLCLQIACIIKDLHTNMSYHSDIKSANILLDKNCQPKLAYFGISKLHQPNQEVGMKAKVYQDPEYETTGKLGINSDIYSFGVVLFEIFCGRLAYDQVYMEVDDKGLAPIARQCFNDGTIRRMIDSKLKEETDEEIFTSTEGPIQVSLDTFLEIAYKCLGEADGRPTIETVTKELETALNLQMRSIALQSLELSTQ